MDITIDVSADEVAFSDSYGIKEGAKAPKAPKTLSLMRKLNRHSEAVLSEVQK